MMPPHERQATDSTPTVTVAEAARRLGLSPDAVRGRLQRGTLAGEKIAGVWHVAGAALPPDTAPTGHPTGKRQDTTGHRQDADRPPDSALVVHLQSENAHLRAELSARSQELAAEREWGDVLMREALGRIEALTAGPVTDAGEPARGAPQRTQEGPGDEQDADGDDGP
jgi:hypothetical protein